MLTDYHVHLRPDEDDSPGRALLHRRPTPSATARPRRERGIEELGRGRARPPLRRSRSTSGRTPGSATGRADDVDEYCDFAAREPTCRLGIEADFLPGREDRMANLLDGRDWDYVVGSVHFLRDEAVDFHGYPDWEPWNIWRGADPEKVWARYFETLGEAARSGMFDILAHPDLVKVWGSRRAGARGRPAALLRARHGRDRGVRRRDRGLHGGAAQAGRRDLPRAGVPRDVPRRGAPGGAVQRRPHARAARLRVRAGARAARRARRRPSSPSSTGAGTAWSRSDEPAPASAGTRTGSRAAGRSCSAAWRSRTPPAVWPATPTRTCSPTR